MRASIFIATLGSFLSTYTYYDPWSPFKSEKGKFILQQTIEYPGQSREDLYQKALSWFETPFQCQLKYTDKTKMTITGGGYVGYMNWKVTGPVRERIHYTLIIEVKEAKIRYTFRNIFIRKYGQETGHYLEDYNQPRWMKKDGTLRKPAAEIRDEAQERLLRIADSLQESMELQPVAEKW